MKQTRFRHSDLFGVFWQSDGGDGEGEGGGATSATATQGGLGGLGLGGTTGGPTGQADAATNAAAVGGGTVANAFGGSSSGPTGLSSEGPASNAGVVGGGGPVSIGGAPTGAPGGQVGGTGGGGTRGGGFGGGATPGGTTVGGGTSPSGFGKSTLRAGPQAIGDPSEAATFARPGGIGTNPSDTALLGKAASIGTAAVPGGMPDAIAILNNELRNLTQGGGGSFGFGDQSQASPLGSPGTTLGQLALAQQRKGMNMGYPAIEGVSPGLTAAPAGPSPSPGQNVNAFGGVTGVPGQTNVDFGPPGLSSEDVTGLIGTTTPAPPAPPSNNPVNMPNPPPVPTPFPSIPESQNVTDLRSPAAKALDAADFGSLMGPPAPVSPADMVNAQNTANITAQVSNQPAATQMNAAADNTAPATAAATPAPGGFGQILRDIFGGAGNPTLPELAQMLGLGG